MSSYSSFILSIYRAIHHCCTPNCLGSRFPPSVISSVILPHICSALDAAPASDWSLHRSEGLLLADPVKICASQ